MVDSRTDNNLASPTVSVIIPTWNRAGWVEKAVASVYGQTRPAAEVIVVDDGSTDGTVEMLRRLFPQLKIFAGNHAGVSAARNRGIEAATGEWLAFLDSDDQWLEQKLATQLAALTAEPKMLVCHTDELWFRNGRRVNPRRRHQKYGGYIYRHCLPLCAISPSSVLIHRSVFADAGLFDEALPACEDYDLWLRICSRLPVLYVDQPLLIKHGGHADQLSRTEPALDRYRIRALEKILSSEDLILGASDRRATVETLVQKIDVYCAGAKKRQRWEEVGQLEELRARYAAALLLPPQKEI